MKKSPLLRVCAVAVLSLGVIASVSAKKLRDKFDDCFLTGIDENGVESIELGVEAKGRATEDEAAGELWMKCRGKVPNLSGEKYELTGGECFVNFISDGAEALTDDNVYKVSKSGRAKLICHATRDDVVQ